MKATRQLEYVCFFPVEVPTTEGDAYVFMAVDAFSKFLFQTGIESSLDDTTILKHIGLLLQHKDFKRHSDKGFTLVFHKYANYQNHVNEIILPHGKFIIDDAFVTQEIIPVAEFLFKSMAKQKQKK
jgi:hypothetical protein